MRGEWWRGWCRGCEDAALLRLGMLRLGMLGCGCLKECGLERSGGHARGLVRGIGAGELGKLWCSRVKALRERRWPRLRR